MIIHFIRYVYTQPDLLILSTFMLSTCVFCVVLYSLLSSTIGKLNIPTDGYFAVAIIGAMTSLVAVLLTFTLIQSINTYNRANEAVLTEISAIELLYKRAVFLDNKYTKDLKDKTRNYVSDIIESDWYTMITGQRSESTEETFNKLLISVSRASHASDVDQETAWDLSTSFGEVVKGRYDRLKLAGNNLPPIYYMAILVLFIIHILQFFLLTKRSFFSLTILNLNMAALGLLLGLVFVYDHPFEGETAVRIELYKDLATRIKE